MRVRVNQAQLDLLGYEHDEYVGHPISEFHVDQPVIDGGLLCRPIAARSRPLGWECPSPEKSPNATPITPRVTLPAHVYL
jgi:hypothetical protein